MTPRPFLAAAALACGIAAPAQAALILQSGYVGGSGDVANVAFMPCRIGSGTGTTVQGCLNSDRDVRVDFTGTEALDIGGAFALVTAAHGALTNFVIAMADATLGFTKLQFNLIATRSGTASFQGVDQFGEVFTFTAALRGTGNNRFTLSATDGQIATSFSLVSTAPLQGITTLQQVRVGAVDLPPVPVPVPASLALFGAGLVGLGLVRRRRPAQA